jgi:hypothetical protein
LGCTLVLALVLLLHPWAAQAQDLRVELRAHVSDDLRYVLGTLRWTGVEDVAFVDAMAALPLPADDRTALRTWPGGTEQGSLRWREDFDDRGRHLMFELEIPDRYGAVGRVPGQGLYLNGGWYPVPVDADGRVLEAQWDVRVDLPEDAAGATGFDFGVGDLLWHGSGERLGLAVVPGGSIERLDTAVGQVVLLSRHGFTEARKRWLQRSVEAAWPGDVPLRLVVVDAPLMRRLVRPSPGLLFLSSRAFRLDPGLKHLHQGAVCEGLLEAGLAQVLPSHTPRDFVAAVYAAAAMAEVPTADGLLRWFAWLPQIDELLYSGSVPYVGEVMGEPWPGDLLADDLLEILDPRLPGAVVAGRAAARGEPVVDIAGGLLAGEPSPVWLEDVRIPAFEQDYSFVVERDAGGVALRVQRAAPPGAPGETLVVAVDAARPSLELPEGTEEVVLVLETPPDRVVLDPDGLLRQTDRSNDRWPSRWTTVLSAFPTVWNLSSGRLEGYLALRFRRQHDTRWYYDSFLFRDEVDELGARAAVGHSWGPLQDRRWRPYRLYVWGSGSLLDPDFRPTDRGRWAVDGGATLVWDTQVDWLFPLRGHRFTLGGHAGFVPASSQRWAGVGASASGVASPHPRLAVAGQARVGRSWGQVEHRLQVLGGVDNLRSVPANLAVGEAKLVTRGELRVAPLRHISVPLGFAWLDEVQLSGGLEAGLLSGATLDPSYGATPADGWVSAMGWTAGSFVVLDILGGQPALAGLVLAGPVAAEPSFVSDVSPNLYLLWEQAF